MKPEWAKAVFFSGGWMAHAITAYVFDDATLADTLGATAGAIAACPINAVVFGLLEKRGGSV